MLLLVAFLSAPELPYKEDTVAIIELNHVHNEDGEHRFDQLIFWELRHCFDGNAVRPTWSYHVRGWRIVRQGEYKFRKVKGRWVLLLWEHDTGKAFRLRRVIAVSFLESRTNYDREVEERKRLPQELRREFAP